MNQIYQICSQDIPIKIDSVYLKTSQTNNNKIYHNNNNNNKNYNN
jgi:hypothetical protein